MSKGFFVVVSRGRRKVFGPDGRAVKYWSAAPVDKTIRDWRATEGPTVEAATEGQREQYDARRAVNEPVPELLTAGCGPMASGRITRFVQV